MRRAGALAFAVVLGAGIQAVCPLPVHAADSDSLIFYTSTAGYPTQIEVFLKSGADPAVAADLLHAANVSATPSDLFVTSGFAWPEFLDHGRKNDLLTQYYNSSGEPSGVAAASILQRVQQTWSDVPGSTFRYAFGGVTTRCPSLSFECPGGPSLDGHNDVGWLPLPYGILGITTTVFNVTTGAALESDVVFSSTPPAPYAWFTDGQEYDVESVMLHELGHLAGLAHSPDPNAVMFATYTGVKRVLTAAETDGLASLYPVQPSVVSQTPSAYDFRLLAALGGPAPGGGTYGGGQYQVFEADAVNGAGDVAFTADVPEGTALFVNRRGTVTQVARSGQTVAGGSTLGSGPYNNFALNDTGETAFSWPLESDVDGNGTLFRADANGLAQAVILPGITPAPGGGIFTSSDSAALSNTGDIAFVGNVDTLPDSGIFVARPDGTITAVARPGDASPGGSTFLQAVFPSIGAGGDIAFRALAANRSNDGVYVWRAASMTIEAIAEPGDPAPGGGVFVRATIPRVNARGDVLFLGRIRYQSRLVYGLYLASRGQLVAIAKPGDVMPDGWGFDGLIVSESSATLNDSGDVAFVARTVRRETGDRAGAVYASSHGALRLVARVGSVILGAGFDVTSVSPDIAAAVIGARGDVVLQVRTLRRQLLLKAGPKAR